METGLLHGNFSMQGEIEAMPGEIEMNLGKLRNLEKLKFPFWVEKTFGDDIK